MVKKTKMSKVEDVCEQSDGALRAKPPATGWFFVIFEKSYFDAIGSHFARVQSNLKELDI